MDKKEIRKLIREKIGDIDRLVGFQDQKILEYQRETDKTAGDYACLADFSQQASFLAGQKMILESILEEIKKA